MNSTAVKKTADEGERPDVLTLMAEIRKRVSEDAEKHRDSRGDFVPGTAQFSGSVTRKAGELLYSEELRYLNTHYAYSTQLDLNKVVSHRGGFLGKIIVKAKQKVLRIIWDSLLRDYFSAEREFQSNVVRFLNDVSKYLDARDAANFWELVRKIDYDVTKVIERVERINDEQMASLRSSERRTIDELNEVRRGIAVLKDQTQGQDAKIAVVDSVARGLEGIIAKLPTYTASIAPAAESAPPSEATPNFSYLLLENRYRGNEEEISLRLNVYPPYFTGANKPVLEMGCGRGELLSLFKHAQVNAFGIDMDEAMVKTALQKGLDVRRGDAIAHLRALPVHSLGGLIAIQVVEHLTRNQLQELFELCHSRVQKGGRIIFETINPKSVLALSSNYFRDPTHVWPQHPDTLSYSMTLAGLSIKEVRYLSPIPDAGKLQELTSGSYMSPRWTDTINLLNRNIEQLNELLYGPQDFCVVAEA